MGSLLFVILCAWFWTEADHQTQYSPLFARIVAAAGIVLFGFGVLMSPRKLMDKRPGLIISDEGIQDNTGVSAGRFISWKNITGNLL